MASNVVKAQDVGKLYRLGEVGTGTVSHDLNRWFARLRGKEDPFTVVGQINDRTKKATSDYVWALKDVNFSIEQGQAVGIIGRNGAGKSTLLKLLSKVTPPTTGNIRVRGRIASLLEVGTGFHPELTGKENIYLNGAILGMSKKEIVRKFDEIVDFAGVERYIDTPVKRYSSGMYVRLAFAVAAHLESEILIVDEVLAVGDAEFQKKCLGKMGDVTHKEGRTVLFVSHNMGAVKNLCDTVMVMDMGRVRAVEETSKGIDTYLSSGMASERSITWKDPERPGDKNAKLNSIRIFNASGDWEKALTTDDDITVEVTYEVFMQLRDFRVTVTVLTVGGEEIFITSDLKYNPEDREKSPGLYRSTVVLPKKFFNLGTYYLAVDIEVINLYSIVMSQTMSFTIDELVHNELGISLSAKPPGILHPVFPWQVEILSKPLIAEPDLLNL